MDSSEIRYPIYIVSKGRWDRPLTANFFLKEQISFKMAVESHEYENYCRVIPNKFLQKLPFQNLGLGSFPARNWCWENSISKGYKKHFLFDDNINNFSRLNNGIRVKCSAALALQTLQNFTDKYENVAISGYNYRYFVTRATQKPFNINTHIYSGMLINNKIRERWRLKYNEDVDLCLQALHHGYCTILLNAFLIDKVSTTVKMKGGNQTELYKNNSFDKKVLKARSLEMMWPQYVKIIMRYNRPHHFVNWKKHFKQQLKKVTCQVNASP